MQGLSQKILPSNETPELRAASQLKIGFDPIYFCEFFEGKQVLQLQGKESKEFIHGIYRFNEFVGFVYLGNKFSLVDVAKLCEVYMPKHLCFLDDYVDKYWDEIWYWKFCESQYAFVYQSVIKKI